ncbi:MAG: hypothetical protein C4K49_06440 [Candidatus Thorarchaeota archaeon]|nr:MAG: hypothetical protein C4K49_06440 [Candidatus Thorarchaeota archaeon]
MESDELFEAISHPMRIEILRVLARRPTRFADLKRKLKIDSSGLLDFHLRKMQYILTTNGEGLYTLNERGIAALQAVETVSHMGWQRRAYCINVFVYVAMNAYFAFFIVPNSELLGLYLIVLALTTSWIVFYSYWSFVKRKIHLRKPE